MLLPHRAQRGGGYERGRPSVSPPHSLVAITLYLNIPQAGGICPTMLHGSIPSQHTGTGIYGWDVGLPSCTRCPTSVHSVVILKYKVFVPQLHSSGVIPNLDPRPPPLGTGSRCKKKTWV